MAPAIAVRVKRWRELMMSGRFPNALSKVPATNPSWTDNVSQFAAPALRCHSLVSAGTTAEPLNHSDMPNSSATANSASVRQRAADCASSVEARCSLTFKTYGL